MQQPLKDKGRLVAAGLILALLMPAAAQAAALPQPTAPQEAQANPPAAVPARTETAPQPPADQAEVSLPDSPSPQQTPQPSSQPGSQPGSQTSPQTAPQAAPGQQPASGQPNNNPKPLGTAAAPYEKTMGVAASRPAGAVIAPGRQRRVRTIWISVAAVVGTAVAVGTVVGLSKASSSRP